MFCGVIGTISFKFERAVNKTLESPFASAFETTDSILDIISIFDAANIDSLSANSPLFPALSKLSANFFNVPE
ncbi:MAG: hypothetical protein ACD_79C01226G0001 [uncultured bacterium]|nr:MAG: hypothetical protein ACD_79C01226G0001 [uncultured bacterium]